MQKTEEAEQDKTILKLQIETLQTREEGLKQMQQQVPIYKHDLHHYTQVISAYLQKKISLEQCK